MGKISQLKKAIIGSLHCIKYRLVNRNFIQKGIVLMSSSSELQMDKNTQFVLGNYVTIESGSMVAGRKSCKVSIGDRVYINRNCTIVARESIEIEDGVTIGPNCCIYDHDHNIYDRGQYVSSKIHIKKNAWIGAGCIILKGITIGEGAVIAAGSIVTKDIPDYIIYRNQISHVYDNTIIKHFERNI